MSSDTPFIKRLRPVTKLVTVSKTRPADITTYAAGDVVNESTSAGTVWTFSNMVRGAGLGGVIQAAQLIDSAAQSTKPDLELYLFDTTLTTQNDNAAWAPADADMKTLVARIDFSLGSFKTAGGNGVIQAVNLSLPFQCASGSTTLYGILVARNAYTPISSEEFTIRLAVLQD